MSRFLRLPTRDPRTIARDIPGISHILFPQLTSGLVTSLNKTSIHFENIAKLDEELIKQSTLKASVLFEFSNILAEAIISNKPIDFNENYQQAILKQNQYYDTTAPNIPLKEIEKDIAYSVAKNLDKMLKKLSIDKDNSIVISPIIYGYEWIANSNGDFSIGNSLIEVKCSNKNFSSSDYRQILIYFLLNYIKSLNSSTEVIYTELILINPRLNKMVRCSADDLLSEVTAGRSKVETVQLFSTMIKERYGDFFN